MLMGMDDAVVRILFWIFLVSALLYWWVGWCLIGRIRYLPPAGEESAESEGHTEAAGTGAGTEATGPAAQDEAPGSGGKGRISVIIPARNEEGNLPHLLQSLAAQRLPAEEVLVVDDHSTDATREVARTYGAEVVPAPPLPQGWTGKSWACYHGARHSAGESLLFVDADVQLAEDALLRLRRAGESSPVVSVQPFHVTRRLYESLSAFPNLVVLAAIGPFGTFTAERAPKGLFGPCILVDAQLYRRSTGHRAVASSVVEDVELAQLFMRHGAQPEVYAGRGAVSFRMYPEGLASLVEGWRKNLSSGADFSYRQTRLLISIWVAGLVNSFLCWAAAAQIGGTAVTAGAAAVWGFYALQLALLLRPVGRFGPLPPLLYPLYFAWFLFLTASSRYRTRVAAKVRWKGRDIHIGVKEEGQ